MEYWHTRYQESSIYSRARIEGELQYLKSRIPTKFEYWKSSNTSQLEHRRIGIPGKLEYPRAEMPGNIEYRESSNILILEHSYNTGKYRTPGDIKIPYSVHRNSSNDLAGTVVHQVAHKKTKTKKTATIATHRSD